MDRKQLCPPVLKCCSFHTRLGFGSPASVGFRMAFPTQLKLMLGAGQLGSQGGE